MLRLSSSYKKGMPTVRMYLFFWLFLVFLPGCQEEEIIHLDPELTNYFDRFALEASNFNITFDYQTDRIEGYLTQIEERAVNGKCERNSVYPDRVFIDLDFWRKASDLEREFVVFHELGHCFLNRGHLDDADPRGVCISMMHSGAGSCRNNYGAASRTAYLQELFTY